MNHIFRGDLDAPKERGIFLQEQKYRACLVCCRHSQLYFVDGSSNAAFCSQFCSKLLIILLGHCAKMQLIATVCGLSVFLSAVHNSEP